MWGGVDKQLILAALRMVGSRVGCLGRVRAGRLVRGSSMSGRQEVLANVSLAKSHMSQRSVRCNGLTKVMKGEGLPSKSYNCTSSFPHHILTKPPSSPLT